MNSESDFLTVHGLFADRMACDPLSAVLDCDGESLSVSELDKLAGRVTARLLAAGIRRGDRVGVRLPHTPVLFAALLGIMRAGAAYVPAEETRDPDERVAQMFGDAEVSLMLTAPGAQPPLAGIDLLEVDAATLSAGPVALGTPGHPDDDAYVMFTSGSTGRPKGVPMTHRALVNMLAWHHRARADSCASRTIQLCTVSQDWGFHEIFATLCLGGRLVLVPPDVRSDVHAVARFLSDEAIERMFPPTNYLMLLAEAAEEDPRQLALRDVLTGGARLQVTPVLRSFFGRCNARLHNHYGATEFQDATTYTLEGDPMTWPLEVPLGRPIDNVEIHLLDDAGAAVLPGDSGELYVGGVQVARGYLNHPEFTAQRFLPHPSGQGRLYRTGDLARLCPDGELEYLWRVDEQVEIQGVRVDTAEVAIRLNDHPAVREATVVVDGPRGYRRLVAHVVLNDHPEQSDVVTELRARLAGLLPSAQVRHELVIREAIPLTPSGKADRRALS